MPIVECKVPLTSALDRNLIDAAYFQDSYRTPLGNPSASMVTIFFAIFGQHPIGIKFALMLRNRIARFCGLDAPTAREILISETKSSYKVGDTIGVWPIFNLTCNELVAGRNNKHLDFRLSVLKEFEGGKSSVVVSTICTVHNVYGKVYLFFIVPLHRWGVRYLIGRAVDAGRL